MEEANRSSSSPSNENVYVAVGAIATELRASMDALPGDVLLMESAFCFAKEDEVDDDDDTDTLPSIVQAALNALEKESPSSSPVSSESAATGRTWEDLIATSEEEDAQKTALFEWGAKQITTRLSTTSDHQKALEAIRRVSLNAFTVKQSSSTDDIPTAHTITNDEDLLQAVMTIGQHDETIGNGVFLLASAANHSCDPNAHVTFHCRNDENDNCSPDNILLSMRAIQSIPAHQAVTISYGPLVGVDGTVRDRRAALQASGTQDFVCRCSACLAEEDTGEGQQYSDSSVGRDTAAILFLDQYITGAPTTAEEALLQSKRMFKNNDDSGGGVASSRLFGKAMSDASLQTIAYDVGIAKEFQKLALQSLELQCGGRGNSKQQQQPAQDGLAIAYELMKLSLLRLFVDDDENDMGKHHKLDVERARTILCRYHRDAYPYRQLLNSLV